MAPETPTMNNCKVGDLVMHNGELRKVTHREIGETYVYTKLTHIGTFG